MLDVTDKNKAKGLAWVKRVARIPKRPLPLKKLLPLEGGPMLAYLATGKGYGLFNVSN